jgi:hypothetical protein
MTCRFTAEHRAESPKVNGAGAGSIEKTWCFCLDSGRSLKADRVSSADRTIRLRLCGLD